VARVGDLVEAKLTAHLASGPFLGSSGLSAFNLPSVTEPPGLSVGFDTTQLYNSRPVYISATDSSALDTSSFTKPLNSTGVLTGTDYMSLSKSISDLTSRGSTIVGWDLMYIASEPPKTVGLK
jgi:hypothetical protein